ncbi:unnamed protein product [marine sediment metagenome]|uniref:Uncharacterized protein n=1 Tax=marine sediment metagenome TaxID=412755 RepID=X1BGA2_9ZZZZ
MIYRRRVIGVLIKMVVALVVVNVSIPWILSYFSPNVRTIALIIANLLIIIISGIAFIPKTIYCNDCGNLLGRETYYAIPCSKCGGNIYAYKWTGSGTTIKIR